MIGQQFSLEHLLPIALQLLEKEPLAAGDFYPGDLLCSVLKVGAEYYEENPKHRLQAKSLLDRALEMVGDDDIVESALFEAHASFERAVK